jgi:hypothetical protein
MPTRNRFGDDMPAESAAVASDARAEIVAPETEAPARAAPRSAPGAPAPVEYRNISSTLLTLDDGRPFPPKAKTVLTEAELARFSSLERTQGVPYITAVPQAPTSSEGGDR